MYCFRMGGCYRWLSTDSKLRLDLSDQKSDDWDLLWQSTNPGEDMHSVVLPHQTLNHCLTAGLIHVRACVRARHCTKPDPHAPHRAIVGNMRMSSSSSPPPPSSLSSPSSFGVVSVHATVCHN
jgi:hypothetical protein